MGTSKPYTVTINGDRYRIDIFGRQWPFTSLEEFCPTCGQPDNCGDCSHGDLGDDDAKNIGAVNV